MSTISVAQSFEDVNLPGDDMFSDPRWVQVEIAPGVKLWDWQPDCIISQPARNRVSCACASVTIAVWLPRLAAMAVSFVLTLLPLAVL